MTIGLFPYIFLIFFQYFLISLFPLKSFGNSLYNFFGTRYQIPIYLGRIEPILISSNVFLFNVRDCLKLFVFLFTSLIMIQVVESIKLLFRKKFNRKSTTNQKWSSLMTLFDLNQKRIIVLTKICSISKFCAMRSHYICIKGMTKSLKIQKRSKYRILQDTGPSYKKIFTHTNNQIFTLTQTITDKLLWDNVKKSCKNG